MHSDNVGIWWRQHTAVCLSESVSNVVTQEFVSKQTKSAQCARFSMIAWLPIIATTIIGGAGNWENQIRSCVQTVVVRDSDHFSVFQPLNVDKFDMTVHIFILYTKFKFPSSEECPPGYINKLVYPASGPSAEHMALEGFYRLTPPPHCTTLDKTLKNRTQDRKEK